MMSRLGRSSGELGLGQGRRCMTGGVGKDGEEGGGNDVVEKILPRSMAQSCGSISMIAIDHSGAL